MLSLRRPTAETIGEFLAAQAKLDFTYPAVGATAASPPEGYTVNHTRIKLGEGEEVFSAAKAALGRRDQFRLGWVEACSPTGPIEAGDDVALLARLLGLWWLNACGSYTSWMKRGRSGDSGSPMARSPTTARPVRSDS